MGTARGIQENVWKRSRTWRTRKARILQTDKVVVYSGSICDKLSKQSLVGGKGQLHDDDAAKNRKAKGQRSSGPQVPRCRTCCQVGQQLGLLAAGQERFALDAPFQARFSPPLPVGGEFEICVVKRDATKHLRGNTMYNVKSRVQVSLALLNWVPLTGRGRNIALARHLRFWCARGDGLR